MSEIEELRSILDKTAQEIARVDGNPPTWLTSLTYLLQRLQEKEISANTHRPWGLDLVHRLGRLDVPADRGIAPRFETGGGQTIFRAMPPGGLEGLHVHYRYRETVYHIVVSQTRAADDAKIGETRVTVDGVEQHDRAIPLIDDRQDHVVEVKIMALPPVH